jgi:hypothetical protein
VLTGIIATDGITTRIRDSKGYKEAKVELYVQEKYQPDKEELTAAQQLIKRAAKNPQANRSPEELQQAREIVHKQESYTLALKEHHEGKVGKYIGLRFYVDMAAAALGTLLWLRRRNENNRRADTLL